MSTITGKRPDGDHPAILVAFGGASPEHEVSVLTAMQAIAVLQEKKIRAEPLYVSKSGRWFTGKHLLDLKKYSDLKKLAGSASPCTFIQNEYGQTLLSEQGSGWFSKPKTIPVDAVLAAFHGSAGENGSFQGVCEMFNLPYTGSGVMGSAVGMNKVTAKSLCRANGVDVVDAVDFFENEWIDGRDKLLKRVEKLTYPVIVKPVNLGSSIGVKTAANRESLTEAVETAFRYDAHLLIEKVISPLLEVNCSVLGNAQTNRASVCERPLGKEELLSFQDKYMRDEGGKGMAGADRIIPADIPDELADSIRETSRKIFTFFECSGLARFDFLVHADTKKFFFNEINTIPGSFSFYLWKESGVSFPDLLIELVSIAKDQHREKNGRIQSYETNLLSKKAAKGIKGLKGSK